MWYIFAILLSFLITNAFSANQIYASSCQDQSATRLCTQRDNVTEYLLKIKKGGTNILSSDDYDSDFFLCEEYTYDCGYVENQNQTVSIANGIQLNMTTTKIDQILPSSPTLATNIKKYLNLSASDAKCGMRILPLLLTAAQSDLFFKNYVQILLTDIKAKYTAQKLNGTKTWTQLNINIKTAVTQVIKQDIDLMSNSFWQDFKANNFSQMSDYLKDEFVKQDQLYLLHSAYLIDSVTKRCNKIQSVNFLVDQSGSIGSTGFDLALQFLTQYITRTYDDPKLTSIHFFDSDFQPYLGYGKTKAQLLAGIAAKPYRAWGTLTGSAINQTIPLILGANYPKGLNKVLVIMTDGFSYDDVLQASNYARSKDITIISVGIGSGANDVQLLQMAQTQSNVIKADSYSQLQKLVSFIENFFCKQIVDLKVNQMITGNEVRVPESPNYFRIQKSTGVKSYVLQIDYNTDPNLSSTEVYLSDYDAFPDQYTDNVIDKFYKKSTTQRVCLITPKYENQVRIKKNSYQPETFLYSYLSVGGNNLSFNISLKQCSTSNCDVERKAFTSYVRTGAQQDGDTPIIENKKQSSTIVYVLIATGSICFLVLAFVIFRKINKSRKISNLSANSRMQPQVSGQIVQRSEQTRNNQNLSDFVQQNTLSNLNEIEQKQDQFQQLDNCYSQSIQAKIQNSDQFQIQVIQNQRQKDKIIQHSKDQEIQIKC